MKLPILLLAAAAAWTQPPLKVATTETSGEKPLVSVPALSELEKHLDEKMSLAGGADPIMLLGESRALRLAGYGVVVTQEISLVNSPYISPFQPKISPQQVALTHQRKIDRLPLLRQTMRDMWTNAAASLTLVPNNEQIVLAVRLLYKSWEDTKGLPGQIVLKGARGAGLAGVQMEEQ